VVPRTWYLGDNIGREMPQRKIFSSTRRDNDLVLKSLPLMSLQGNSESYFLWHIYLFPHRLLDTQQQHTCFISNASSPITPTNKEKQRSSSTIKRSCGYHFCERPFTPRSSHELYRPLNPSARSVLRPKRNNQNTHKEGREERE
jgi:hypothetical protein